jgi:UDP-N-acetylglucosamine--N-acetylmuramyl-(pentapeptide) pyrophosphoryl-undecaprenol N-acetylglucosamine transferase
MRRTILFAGGGTLGPVTPLLAVAARLREAQPEWRFAWVGTDDGPERELVQDFGMGFLSIQTARLPRYLSKELFMAPFDYLRARRDASRMVDLIAPSLVISAGGYTAVPIMQEAAGRELPCIAHQLDYVPGLSNRMAAKHCRYVTTSFEYHYAPFGPKVVTYHIPTPARFSLDDLPSRSFACKNFGFDPERPVILVTGGGTGAKSLNEAFYAIRGRLPSDVQILHLTGKGKADGIIAETPSYIVNEFLSDDMNLAFAAADVVVSRAGVGAISELAALKKASILVPLPNSPQEQNARALHQAVRVVPQHGPGFGQHLLGTIIETLHDERERKRLGEALHHAFPTDRGQALANLALSVLV